MMLEGFMDGAAFATITSHDANGWFAHTGYLGHHREKSYFRWLAHEHC
jgi:hypothetical protein